MACTTLLAGRLATNDGSTIIARNEDCENGDFNVKGMVAVLPEDQPRTYTGVNSHLTFELPDDPVRYVCTPDTDLTNGIWGEAGMNAWGVGMSATETITSNPRVLGADPLVVYDATTGTPGGLGEEDLVTVVLPYIKSAREGVLRLGKLLETYGTYETNGIAFNDERDVWYLETIGGHHWIARRVPDDCYVAQPNRQGIDTFDLADALGDGKDHLCSPDLAVWISEHHLVCDQLANDTETVQGAPAVFDARAAFSSFSYLDIIYNNPRAWYLCTRLSRQLDLGIDPESFDAPWALKPAALLGPNDIKDALSATYQGTVYDCYGTQGTEETRHRYRPIGINRTCELSVLQVRPHAPAATRCVQWTSFGSGPFATAIAMFANVTTIPDYLATTLEISTDKFYWVDRLIAALADPEYFSNYQAIQDYQQTTMAAGYASLANVDTQLAALAAEKGIDVNELSEDDYMPVLEAANQSLCDLVEKKNADLLASVLYTRSLHMKNAFGAQDH